MGNGPANQAVDNQAECLCLNILSSWDNTFTTHLNSLLGLSEAEWLPAMTDYLNMGKLPEKKNVATTVQSTTPAFHLCDELLQEGQIEIIKVLDHINRDSTHALYLTMLFHTEFIQQIHEEFSHLGYPGLLGVIWPWAWWSIVSTDIKHQVCTCPACQVSQTLQPALEQEVTQH